MRIAYLHGLESDNKGAKNDFLRTIAEVYDPAINYHENSIYSKILKNVKEFKPDFIIGSSMGGYFAYEIAKTLAIPALLFNPALHSRSFDPDMNGLAGAWNNPKMHIVFGRKDKVIDPAETLKIINSKRVSHAWFGHGHQTPPRLFISQVKEFAKL
jgi:uncharacterized protein